LVSAPAGDDEEDTTMNPIPIVLIAGAGALIILVVGVVLSVSGGREEAAVEKRLESFAATETLTIAKGQVGPVKRASPLGDAFNRLLAGRAVTDRISTQLARADLKLTVGEYIALLAIAIVGGGVIGYLIGGRSVIFAVLGAAAGYFAPGMYVGYMQGRRVNMFNDQLGDTINLLVNGLRSGYSILQAMEAVARELPQPVAGEFDRVVKEVQLGLTLEQALQNMLRRVKSDDLDLVVTAINVQREVGGNLAEILEVISHTIRERVRIKGEVRVLTAQGMLTGYVISFLPVAITLVLYLVNKPYIELLWKVAPCGWVMLGVGILLIVSGFLIIQKIVKIEV
jgi:tight adherence protein B